MINVPAGFCKGGKEPFCVECLDTYSKRGKTVDKEVKGRMKRVCKLCNNLKDLEDDFYKHAESLRGRDKRCKKCHSDKGTINMRLRRKDPKLREGHNRASKKYYRRNRELSMWRDARYRAKMQDLPFDIEVSDITIPDKCPILGIGLTIGNSKENRESSASLDKINPKLGYVKGNVQVISSRANTLKSNLDMSTLIKLYSYMKKGDWDD